MRKIITNLLNKTYSINYDAQLLYLKSQALGILYFLLMKVLFRTLQYLH
jgi:hypothetical protein